jgi:tetratricopeptide (TPR) repeat protein
MDPAALQQLLFDAVARRDAVGLESLCRQHQAQIVELFPAWRIVPQPLRDRPADAQKYIESVVAIARIFDERMQQPALLQSLMGDPKDNPLVRWQQDLEAARKEMEGFRYKRAVDRLKAVLAAVKELRGSGADAYLPVTHGSLGECYFQTGLAEKAVAPTKLALDLCRRSGDLEGVAAYLGNLYEIHRWLSQAQQAAICADELADVHDQRRQPDEAARYRRQAELVRKGEPPLRVIVAINGRRYEMDEVRAGVEGKIEFLLERNRLALRPSGALTARGEEEAKQGRFDKSVARFSEAAHADRYNPQPHYQAALAMLYLQRYTEAAQEYERTERRAPGWFYCRSGLWMARQLEAGNLSHQAFMALHMLEDGPLPSDQKVALAERTLKEADLGLVHLHHGKHLLRIGRRPEADAALRRGLERAEEPDVRTRLLVDLAAITASADEKRRLLEEAVALKGNLVASAMAEVVLRFGVK